MSLGFKVVSKSGQFLGNSIHGFYDFNVQYNQQTTGNQACNNGDGSDFMQSAPIRGLKRIWVRSQQICPDIVPVAVSFPTPNFAQQAANSSNNTVAVRLSQFMTSDYPQYKQSILSSMPSFYISNNFITQTQSNSVPQALTNLANYYTYNTANSTNTYLDPN